MNICKKCGKQIISLIPEEKCYCNETYATNHTELVYKEALNTFATVPYVNGHIRNFHKPYEEVRKDFKTLEDAISKAEKYDEKETGKKLVEKTKKLWGGRIL